MKNSILHVKRAILSAFLNRILSFLTIAVCALVAACGSAQPPLEPSEQSPFKPVVDIHETMEWILEPAADVIWDSAGFIITAEGERNLTPTTEEGWAAVLHAAVYLTEAGNLLMLPGRSAGEDWNEYSRGLIAAGELAIDAALEKDGEALFDAGGRVYQVCRACHNQYWIKGNEE